VPFTPSHAAAILPFLRTPLPASALVVGSIAPDIPYYLPVDFPWRTHTALGVVTTDLVLGVLAWAVWHALLSEPALAGSPAGLRARLAGVPLGLPVRVASLRRLVLVVLAVAVGAGSHVLWDEFTHPRRWGTEHAAVLADTWGLLPGYRWLQYAGGLVGAAVLLVWFVLWWRRTPPRAGAHRPAARSAWALVAAAGVLVGVPAALTAGPGIGAAGYAGATWGGGAALAVAVLLALAWHAVRERSPR
jgi:hypothetical protein